METNILTELSNPSHIASSSWSRLSTMSFQAHLNFSACGLTSLLSVLRERDSGVYFQLLSKSPGWGVLPLLPRTSPEGHRKHNLQWNQPLQALLPREEEHCLCQGCTEAYCSSLDHLYRTTSNDTRLGAESWPGESAEVLRNHCHSTKARHAAGLRNLQAHPHLRSHRSLERLHRGSRWEK